MVVLKAIDPSSKDRIRTLSPSLISLALQPPSRLASIAWNVLEGSRVWASDFLPTNAVAHALGDS